MARYKITYEQLSQRIMEVEADSPEEARQKYENFDCISDHEDYGIEESVKNIKKVSE
ncbi:hypothetical protein [Bacillus infantis]|uniref:hypothetical protein n=1 Tax=Bacillus infantis TaxID=324767 RepID=UPI003CFA8BBF